MITEEILRKVAEIARLRLSQAELASFRKELEEILAHFSKIQKMGEGEAEHYGRRLANSLREDRAECWAGGEDILANFNRREGRLLVAPKSLE
ncbi:MAG: Asp-tRNA(Asn)/Glu-tRNA(Gln) amidotransferase subunit GatC [Candidatus Micrarchaeia archaeon]